MGSFDLLGTGKSSTWESERREREEAFEKTRPTEPPYGPLDLHHGWHLEIGYEHPVPLDLVGIGGDEADRPDLRWYWCIHLTCDIYTCPIHRSTPEHPWMAAANDRRAS